MKSIRVIVTLCVVLLFCSCDSREPVRTATSSDAPASNAVVSDISKLVRIAAVKSRYAEHVTQVLKQAGIQPLVVGAESCLVLVPSGTESRAVSLLRADSASQKYQIQFE